MQTRAPLTALTLNRGDHAEYHDIREAIGDHAVTFLQEMMAVPGILDELRDDGLRVWHGPGQAAADAVVWDPRQIKVHDRLCLPLLPGGVRNGTRNMDKHFNAIRGTHRASGRTLVAGSCHNIQKQTPGSARERAALLFMQNLHEKLEHIGCSVLVGVDTNIAPEGHSLTPFRNDKDYRLSQIIEPTTTFGKSWEPDEFILRSKKGDPQMFRFHDQKAVTVKGTDHKGLSGVFSFLVR